MSDMSIFLIQRQTVAVCQPWITHYGTVNIILSRWRPVWVPLCLQTVQQWTKPIADTVYGFDATLTRPDICDVFGRTSGILRRETIARYGLHARNGCVGWSLVRGRAWTWTVHRHWVGLTVSPTTKRLTWVFAPQLLLTSSNFLFLLLVPLSQTRLHLSALQAKVICKCTRQVN